ncbi:NAD(P)-binding protein [Mycena floridula]|nr:NAD(P)-binding protein [Mycena floridula]
MGNTLGNIISFLSQAYFSGKPTWSTDQIPDLTGKVVIVTGGNSGLGKETVKGLLEHNAKVYIACRNRQTAEKAIEELKKNTGNEALYLQLDLADLLSVKSAALEFISKEKHLHLLFNNAAVMMPPVAQTTPAGHDLSMGINVLGHFYLTKLLVPVLRAAAQDSGGKSRVITTSSGAHYVAMYDFDAFNDGPIRRNLSLMDLYGQSKWANIVFSTEFARRYGSEGIVSCSLNPGNFKDTRLGAHITGGYLYWTLKAFQIYPAKWGALTQLYAGTCAEGESFNGKFLVPWARVGKAAPSTSDPENGRKLWEWMEQQVKYI